MLLNYAFLTLQCYKPCLCVNYISQEKLLLEPMFEVPDSDITAVHIEEGVVLGQNPVGYSRSSPSQTDDSSTASDSPNNGRLSQDRESLSRTGDSVAA